MLPPKKSQAIGDTAYTVFEQDLCLYQSRVTRNRTTQQTASIIVRVPEHARELLSNALAYVVSFERIYGSDTYLVRAIEVRCYDPYVMRRF